MTSVRANFLPDPALRVMRGPLEDYLSKIALNVTPANFGSVCDQTSLVLLKDCFQRIGADEGSIWIIDTEHKNLVVAYNSGDQREEILGHKQVLSEGFVSMVAATEQPIIENRVYRNAQHSPQLDRKLGFTTNAMMIVPLYFARQLRGVISCVQLVKTRLERDQDPPHDQRPAGFVPANLATLRGMAIVMGHLVDYNLVCTATGLRRPS